MSPYELYDSGMRADVKASRGVFRGLQHVLHKGSWTKLEVQ